MFPFILSTLIVFSVFVTLPAQSAEKVTVPPQKVVEPSVPLPVIEAKKATIEDDYEIVPASLPKGWKTCGRSRLRIAYINALPVWQRFFLSPYRTLEATRYKHCAKALLPSTQAFMETTYLLPYVPIDPQTSLKPKSLKPQIPSF
ncbi:MAG: hypothetical protein ACK551_01060 [Vampirovibrionales bacterium]